MSTLERAVAIAAEAHAGQIDKAGAPYILHPVRLMLQMETTQDQIVAVLHDVVEDSEWSYARLRDEGFSQDVVEAVDSVTRRHEETYEEFVLRAGRNPIGRRVKLADLRDNSDLGRISNPTAEDIARIARYQRAMALLEGQPSTHKPSDRPPVIRTRPATEADAELIAAAESATAEEPGLLVQDPGEISLESFRTLIAQLAQAGRYVVALDDDRVVGHAMLDPMRMRAVEHVFRLTIVVHQGQTGRGIGNALMMDLMGWAQHDARVGKIELLVRATNTRAIRLYNKFGFGEEGRFRKRLRLTDGTFVDDIAMAWIKGGDV